MSDLHTVLVKMTNGKIYSSEDKNIVENDFRMTFEGERVDEVHIFSEEPNESPPKWVEDFLELGDIDEQ